MGTTLLGTGDLLVDDDLQNEAHQFVELAHDRNVTVMTVTLTDGSAVELPRHLASFIEAVLQGVSRGPVSVSTIPEELTSTLAADLLGISRPTLMKWVLDGRLPSHRVGSHHRFKTEDVMALSKSLGDRKAEAFDELRSIDEALERSESRN